MTAPGALYVFDNHHYHTQPGGDMEVGTKGWEIDERTELARRALDLARVKLDDIAEAVGASRGTLAAYRTGHRPLPAPVAWKMAEWLRAHAAEAQNVADELARLDP